MQIYLYIGREVVTPWKPCCFYRDGKRIAGWVWVISRSGKRLATIESWERHAVPLRDTTDDEEIASFLVRDRSALGRTAAYHTNPLPGGTSATDLRMAAEDGTAAEATITGS